jgi:hypothetical protein
MPEHPTTFLNFKPFRIMHRKKNARQRKQRRQEIS